MDKYRVVDFIDMYARKKNLPLFEMEMIHIQFYMNSLSTQLGFNK